MNAKTWICLLATALGVVHLGNCQKCPSNIQDAYDQCFKMMNPKGHPLFVPIIGGADVDYARDMCSQKTWAQGMSCMKNLDASCARGAKESGMIRNCYSAENTRRAAEYFCSKLDAYISYAPCYFDQGDYLRDCNRPFQFQIANLYFTAERRTLDSLIQGYCKASNDRMYCQDKAIRIGCGAAAADVILNTMRTMRAPKCNGATKITTSVFLISVLALVSRVFL